MNFWEGAMTELRACTVYVSVFVFGVYRLVVAGEDETSRPVTTNNRHRGSHWQSYAYRMYQQQQQQLETGSTRVAASFIRIRLEETTSVERASALSGAHHVASSLIAAGWPSFPAGIPIH